MPQVRRFGKSSPQWSAYSPPPTRMESEGISRLEENADRVIMANKRRKFPCPSCFTACLSFPPFRSCSPGSVCTFGFASGVAPQTIEIPCMIYTLMQVMHPIFYIANQASLRSFVYALGLFCCLYMIYLSATYSNFA